MFTSQARCCQSAASTSCVIRHNGAGFNALNSPGSNFDQLDPIAMAQADTAFQLLYVSHLAADCDFSVVKEIVEVARRSNPALGITGALLFDGERFCQLLEGGEAEVRGLMDRIAADARHTRVRVLHAAQTSAGLVMHHWASGYCDAHELDVIDAAAPDVELSLMGEFTAVLNRADIF